MKSMSPFRCAIALAAVLIAAAASPSRAAAQIYVLESTTATIKVGSAIDMGTVISIPAGSHIRAVLPSGKTQTIKGPYNGTVADLAKGQPINSGVAAWLENILKTGGATQSTTGATRGIARPADKPPRAAFSWSTIPLADGTVCIQKGSKLHLLRIASSTAERVTIADVGTGQRAEAQWEADRDTADWPAGLAPRDGVTYYVLVPDRPARQITVRVLDRLPAEDDVLAELQRLDCKAQFEAWVRGKLAASQ
jgi:hypothetical protein